MLNLLRYEANEIKSSKRIYRKIGNIMKIIESKIGEVKQREINAKRMKEKIKSVDMTIATHKGAEYKRKTVDVKNKRLENMW